MEFDKKENLSDRLKQELDKKSPERDTVIQILKDIKKEESGGDQTDPVLEKYKKKPQREKTNISSAWWKRVAVAAIVCLIVLASVPNVFGSESIFTRIGQWTKEIFSFGEIKEKEFVYQTNHPGLQELYDTVAELDLSRNVVPTWIPEDAVLNRIYTKETPVGTMVYASFVYNGNHIGFDVYVYNDAPDTEYQKSEEDIVVYESEGIKHYIVENNEKWTAAWSVDNVECTMDAKDKDVLYEMLRSIYDYQEEIQ